MHPPHFDWCFSTVWGTSPTILQVAPLPVVENSVCSQPEWWGSIALKTMVCAGGDGVLSGCQVLLFTITFKLYYLQGLAIFLIFLFGCDIFNPLGRLWRSPELFHRRGMESPWCCQLRSGWHVQPVSKANRLHQSVFLHGLDSLGEPQFDTIQMWTLVTILAVHFKYFVFIVRFQGYQVLKKFSESLFYMIQLWSIPILAVHFKYFFVSSLGYQLLEDLSHGATEIKLNCTTAFVRFYTSWLLKWALLPSLEFPLLHFTYFKLKQLLWPLTSRSGTTVGTPLTKRFKPNTNSIWFLISKNVICLETNFIG